jgi:hypothetical protein
MEIAPMEIFAGVEACNASMGASSGIPRLMQLLRRRGRKKSRDSVSCWLG